MRVETLIVGAGPAGIGTALGLGSGHDFLILEKHPDLGGGSGTIEFDGAVFDLGGHSFHTPHPEVRDLVFEALPMFEQKRDARCLTSGSLIPYPFQKNFREIKNSAIVDACTAGLDLTGDYATAANYEDFILKRFGPGISEHFMLPYNRKLWGRDLKRLSANWVSERVAAPEGIQEKFDLSGGKRKPLQDDTKVAYPARGGFGEIFKALAQKISAIRFNSSVRRIDLQKKTVTTQSGEQIEFNHLVSSMPVNELLKLIDEAPVDLKVASERLDYLSLKIVMVVVGHAVDTEIQRVYSSEAHVAAHKTAVNHNSSDYLRALPQHGIMAEVSYSESKPLARPDLETWVVDNLLEMNLIKDRSEVRSTRVIDAKYAYPVPTKDRISLLQPIKDFLWKHQVHTIGRFGDWDYINSDEVLYRGLTLGKSLCR